MKAQFLDLEGLTELVGYLKTYIQDDNEILYYASSQLFPENGEENIVYIDTSTGIIYRWNVTSKEYIALSQNVKYAISSGTASTAINVAGSLDTTNVDRHIWFSTSDTETKRSYDDNLKYNPVTNTISANISGTAAIANVTPWSGVSGKPTTYPPSEHNHPYISNLKIDGKEITYTKGDGTTGTITTQDTWRDIQNNLTSTSIIDSLSAAQGKILNEKKLEAIKLNGFYGMGCPNGDSNDWIRTTSKGILPYESGEIGSGHSSLGTDSWYFSKAYIDNIFGNLQGNAKTATGLQTPRKIGQAIFDGTADITLLQMGINNPVEITRAEFDKLDAAGEIDDNTYYNILDDYDYALIVNDDAIATNQTFSSVKTEKIYSKKSIKSSITLSATNWSGTTAPYRYDLMVEGITDSNIIEINCSPSASNAAIAAYQNSGFKDGGQIENQLTILSDKKPDVNIPIVVIIRNDL